MRAWPSVTLGDICELKYGKSLSAANRVVGKVEVYGSNGVVGTHKSAITEGPTIVIGRKGSFGEIKFSPMACWPIDTTYYVDKSATSVDLAWLAHLLPTLRLTELNRAAAIPGLNREDAYRRTLLLPPIEEQRRIAAILDQADALRTTRREALGLLDDLTQSIFLDMFGDPVSNPKCWPTRPLSAWGEVVTGNTPSRASESNYGPGIEWIKSDNIESGRLYATEATESLTIDGRRLARTAPAGSILIVCIAGSPASIGRAAMLDRTAAFNQQINALIPSDDNSLFLLSQLRVSPELVRSQSTGGMKGLVSKSRLSSVQLTDPPKARQRDFITRVEAAILTRESAATAAHQCESLFEALQARAFSGRL